MRLRFLTLKTPLPRAPCPERAEWRDAATGKQGCCSWDDWRHDSWLAMNSYDRLSKDARDRVKLLSPSAQLSATGNPLLRCHSADVADLRRLDPATRLR